MSPMTPHEMDAEADVAWVAPASWVRLVIETGLEAACR